MVLLVCLGAPTLARAQISPGPLARPHAQLEGTLQCAKCHAGGRGGGKEQMAGLCLNCHKEIAWLVERGSGLHGSAPVKAQRCASCHPDHAGVDFALISWEGLGGSAERFEHTRAGWPLDGSHGRQKCSACHKTTFRISPVVRLSQRPKADPGWLGLARSCTVVSRRRAPRRARQELPQVPRRRALEACAAVRSREDELPAHGRSRHGNVRGVPRSAATPACQRHAWKSHSTLQAA